MVVQKPTRRLPRWLKIVRGIVVAVFAVVCVGVVILVFFPDVAAQNIDRLRDIIGDAPVAQLETSILSIQDQAQKVEYQLGLRKPAAPWEDSQTSSVIINPTLLPTPGAIATAAPSTNQIVAAVLVSSLPSWQPSTLTPFGKLAGEGQWSPYVQAADGQTTVAYRTFLEPDPRRPYSVTAIVAFDLRATRLHLILGTVEPIPLTPQPSRTGTVPISDLQPGVLLATFNGGFKARHGHYGAMADGLVALPPINGLASVAMYADGHVKWVNGVKMLKTLPISWPGVKTASC